MTKAKKGIALGMFAVMAVTGCWGMLSNTFEDNSIFADAAGKPTVSPMVDSTDITPPQYQPAKNEKYDCLVRFAVYQADNVANQIEFFENASAPYPAITVPTPKYEYAYLVATPTSYSTECRAPYGYYRAAYKNDSTGVYLTTYKYQDLVGQKIEANHTVIDSQTSMQIGTEFDSQYSLWEHGLTSNNAIIYFSIAYEGTIVDGHVNMPTFWGMCVGTRESDPITINGVTFTVRMGPNKVSVKASTPVLCDNYRTMFAFRGVN